jgi:hypothetical protein
MPRRTRARSDAEIVDLAQRPWEDTAEAGLRLKPVRRDDARGLYLGLVGFDAMTRSGLHQHRGVATSFVLDGGLTDHHGSLGLHQAGINLHGATHDAIAYRPTVLVSRLEGPVVYPPERDRLSGLHAGSRHAQVVNPAPEVPPEINVDVDRLPEWQTGVEGVTRRMIFDYAGTGSAHRFVQLALRPGTSLPAWEAGATTDLWLRGGLLEVDGRPVVANSFVTIPAGTRVGLASPYGALLLAWAEAPERWCEPADEPGPRTVRRSLFGF